MPGQFAKLNEKRIPQNALILIACLSMPIPFLGRTAIGWIVNISTIGATIIYGFVSAATYKTARTRGDKVEMITGAVAFVIMFMFGVYLLFPNVFLDYTLETETYLLLIVWSVVGFFYFRRIILKDHARRFGKAIIVWIALLALIVLMAMIWSGRWDESITRNAITSVRNYYEGTLDASVLSMNADDFIQQQFDIIHRSNVFNTLLILGLFVMALGAMLINHFSLRKWESQTAKERDSAREVAYRDPLTGVKSKHAYVEYERGIAEEIYNGTSAPFAVVVCDVNGLKHINDTFGHQAGDQYICSACMMICKYFKHSPVFRIGGDEFTVILKGDDYENRHQIMKDINETIEQNVGTTEVVASLGMAEFNPETDNTFHAVFTRADSLMYERKKQLKAFGAITRE